MDSYLRTCLPYCFQLEQRTDGKAVYVPLNRRYQRLYLGLIFNDSLYALAKRLSLPIDPETVYLYDDATAPDRSEQDRTRYFSRLNAISKLGVEIVTPAKMS